MNINNHRVAAKLRSKKGASITFALLLFLICAIISTVVIVAATTAAGRMSGMATSEQQYYLMSSTAKMIQEQMEDKKVTVIRTGSGDEGEIYFVNDGGTEATAVSSISGAKTLPQYTAYRICKNMTADASLNVTLPVSVKEGSGVTITEAIEDNTVLFTIKSVSGKQDYTFQLEFATTATPTDIQIEGVSGKRIDYSWTLGHAGSY